MANLRQLSDLRTSAYRLADMENALNRFPVAEVNSYLNQGIFALYDVLVNSCGGYFENNVTIVTDGISTTYPLPQDFMRLLLVQMNVGNYAGVNGYNVALTEFNMNERPALTSSMPGFNGFSFAYRIHNGTQSQAGLTQGTIPTQYGIEILPRASPSLQIQIFYVPSCPQLVNDTDTLDTINGWDYYAVAFAAKLMRMKDDLPTDSVDSLMQMIKERINGMAPRRSSNEPKRINDLRSKYSSRMWRRSGYWNRC